MSHKKKYINDFGNEVPENKILIIPHYGRSKTKDVSNFADVVKPLKGQVKRSWFDKHFYNCLPLNIGNQYGFIIRSNYDFDARWNGETGPAGDIEITFKSNEAQDLQWIESHFGHGILTISHSFYFKTPPGVNLMTIQPPNDYVPGIIAMTGVVEADQLRRDFTFNLKITEPNKLISFKKGDPLAAFIPIPRYYVDGFDLDLASNHFSEELMLNEFGDQKELYRQRAFDDPKAPNQVGRKYFNGEHAFGCPYLDHQKRMDENNG